MRHHVLLICVLLSGLALSAQSVILNFESMTTSADFQYFGMGSLDGTFASNITNPDPSGINTSSTVLEFTKEGTAQTWGGAFGDPSIAVDLTSDNQVCVKVWMDHIGNLALKLELSSTGGPDWISTVSNTTVNQWEEVCFDMTLPSIEPPAAPAAGNVYDRVVLFVDFGTGGTGSDVVTYIDDLVSDGGGGPSPATVDFAVDLNDYPTAFSNVYVNGTFNGWCGDCDELTDADGDGIYTGSITATTGAMEYKYTVDTDWEQLSPYDECVITDPTGAFTNRYEFVTGDLTLDAACFGSCYACGLGVPVTVQLGFPSTIAPDPAGVWLAGGGNFDIPGGPYQMLDDDGDGIYTIEMERYVGFGGYFSFANGDCPDWSCKEDISGQSCARPENFNDRLMDTITSSDPVVISACFADCSGDATCGDGGGGPSTSVEEAGLNASSLTPNVSAGTTTVIVDPSVKNVLIEVYDATGRLLLTQQMNGTYHTLQSQGWSAGTYFVRLLSEGKAVTKTWTIQ